jgi:hypothetical protein
MKRSPSLAAPFACLGLYGGWLSAHMTVANNDVVPVVVLLTLFTPMSCAILGFYLGDRIRKGFIARTLIATIVAGVMNGFFVGMFTGAGAGLLIGPAFGLFYALPFIPATLLTAGFAHRVGRAAPGSIVDRADRRAVWRAVALSISLASLVTLFGHASGKALIACLAASLASLFLFFVDIFALDQAIRLGRVAKRCLPYDESRHGAITLTRSDELGLGEDRFVEIAAAESPYRDADRVARVVVGDPERSRGALVSALILDGVVLLISLGCAGAVALGATCF